VPTISKTKPNETQRPQSSLTADLGSSAWDLPDTMRMVLYGDSGTGKTTLWATFPGPILALVCSGGNKPGELRSIDTPEYRKKIMPRIITSTDQLADELVKSKERGYQTLVLDHVTSLLNILIKEHLGLSEIPATKKWGMAQQRDWSSINDHCIDLLRLQFNQNGNIVVVGQEGVFKAKEEGLSNDIVKPAVGIAVTPGIGKWLNPSADFIVQTYKRPRMTQVTADVAGVQQVNEVRGRGVDYCLRTGPHDIFMTKFRVPKGCPLSECLVDPTYSMILAVSKGLWKPE
jgi:hypothetical protein